jgi:hypothetical protein
VSSDLLHDCEARHSIAAHDIGYNGVATLKYRYSNQAQEVPDNRMNNSNSSPAKSSRVTLKLPAGARKSPRESKTPPLPRPPNTDLQRSEQQRTGKSKTGAHWSDEYKERMQAEMDALTR